MLMPRHEYEKTRKAKYPNFISKMAGWLLTLSFLAEIRPFLLTLTGASIGKNLYIARFCVFDDTFGELIKIGDHVTISPCVIITAHDGSTDKGTVGEIVIKNGAYLGAGCIILPGVTIGENSAIGAGAVVTKDVPAGTTVVGIPAKPIERHSEPRFQK